MLQAARSLSVPRVSLAGGAPSTLNVLRKQVFRATDPHLDLLETLAAEREKASA